MRSHSRHSLLSTLFVFILLASLIGFISCTSGDDDDDSRSSGDDDDDDDDNDDDDNDVGDDDDDDDDDDVRSDPSLVKDVTFEMSAASMEVFTIQIETRPTFIRFGDYSMVNNAFDVVVAPGSNDSPALPDGSFIQTGEADYANNPGWSISLDELTMPITITVPDKADPVEGDVDLQNVVLTGIFELDASAFIFGTVSYGLPGSFFSELLGTELCDTIAGIPGAPDICTDGMDFSAENLSGTRRDDATWE